MIIGVTGTLASGKSTVAGKIAEVKNGKLLDADRIAHSILDKDASVHLQLISFFGKRILKEKGKIDRKKLADIVFSDREKLKFLCDVIHPKVVTEIEESTKGILQKNKDAYVVIDAPMLIEAGLKNFCDLVIVVTATISNILRRVAKHGRLTKKEALKRIRAQMPVSEKEKYADYVIHNDGSLKELEGKAKELIDKID
ncbi:MAG: dephospho-CoA kinase [Candidatus Omnitrophota bacterium]|nr:MAG: dephospho-CoA kinase [Candidatus Omnitrophota bacterium]